MNLSANHAKLNSGEGLSEVQQPNDLITREELRAELDASEKRIHEHLSQIALRLERAETTLLTGFRNYA